MLWKIIDNEIIIIESQETFKPDALTIFKAEFKEQTIFNGISLNKPSADLQGITFSKAPLDMKIHVRIEGDKVMIDLLAFNGKEIYDVDEKTLSNDYIISNNIWYPLIPGKKDEIQNLLSKSDITSKTVTFRKVLNLKRSAALYGVDIEESIKDEILILDTVEDCNCFTATLYKYQRQGFQWMNFMLNQELGLILADEMGLGKSIQIIRLICERITNKMGCCLIVAPASILENWKREFKKFTKDISILIHQGKSRTGSPTYLKFFNVVITSYETLNSDFYLFKMIKWDIVVADEAQAIKNPTAQRTQTIKQLVKNFSIAITGTPFENKLTDVWSLIDFVNPNYLPTQSEFEKEFDNSVIGAEDVEPYISPIILKRKVSEVARDLPEKILIDQAITLDDSMIENYEVIRTSAQQQLTPDSMFATLIKLRMFCCDPSLVLENSKNKNNKLERLLCIVEEIITLNEKLLIFTSFQKMIDIIQTQIINNLGIYCQKVDGRTPIEQRQIFIDEFSNRKGSAALILNPKAAGTGLNITAANHVIHYNSEWNPATEDQATARAYRGGQDKPVRVYKLFYAGTIEELIQDRLISKRLISETAIVGVTGNTLSFDDMLNALNFSPKL